MSAWTNEELRAAVDKVAKRAKADPSVMEQALRDPAAAIKASTGKALPEGVTMRVVQAGGGLNVAVAVDPAELAGVLDRFGAAGCCQIPDALEVCCAKDIRSRPGDRINPGDVIGR